MEALEAQGYKFSGMGEALMVSKGSMTVLKTERTMNLYRVIESVVIGDSSIATEKENTTSFLHMRLEHMRERGHRALHNK